MGKQIVESHQSKKQAEAMRLRLEKAGKFNSVFSSPQGAEVLGLIKEMFISRPLQLPEPNNADNQVAYLYLSTKRRGNVEIINYIENQMRLHQKSVQVDVERKNEQTS